MVTRAATMADLPAVYGLVAEMHARSKYAGDTEVDQQTVRAIFMQAVQRHGGKNNGATWFVVEEDDGQIIGFMLGILQRLYLICNRLEAQDMFLYVADGASPRAAPRLLSSYVEWAESCPKVGAIKLSYTDALGVDGEKLGALYERRLGFASHGAIYEKVMA